MGCLKFETVSEIKEFVGLKSKMYAFEYSDACKKKAKGIKRCALNNLSVQMYKEILFNKSFNRIQQAAIVSKKHEISTVFQNKVGLSAFYDKKYVLEDGIHSRSYGHMADN